MVTNLPPEVRALEYQYLNAKTLDEKIKILEEIIAKTPKHKGTQKYLAQLKRRLKKLKEQQRSQIKRRSYIVIPKDLEFRICIFGAPYSGKTALLKALCGSYSQRWNFVLGTLRLKDVPVQVVECPGYLAPEVCQVLAAADLILGVVDLTQPLDYQLELLKEAKSKFPATPFLLIASKADEPGTKKVFEALVAQGYSPVPVSVKHIWSLEQLKDKMFEALGIVRIYTKEPGKEPSKRPLILKRGCTVKDVAEHIHKDFIKNFRYARVWGKSAKFPGQAVGLEHILEDGDIVEIHTR
ncbi:MAG: TGS domain-containing protein [bacterium]|nr:TGS domain-containing protein [bacterium]